MDFVAAVLLLPAALVCVYYWVHAGRALAARRRPRAALAGTGHHRFAIVIPAHDEERDVGHTVRACRALDYPHRAFDIYVVADNCSDATAEVARSAGATVLERNDPRLRGKGYALSWAFEQLLRQDYDALVVVDADCELDGHALRSFDAHLSAGDKVLQASYVASNPDTSTISYMAALGNHIENNLFYAGKGPHQAALLRGTGMVLHREVLERLPWRAHSIVEDAEYTLSLLRQGYRVRFLPHTRVLSPFADSREQLQVQRTRWAQGNIALGRSHAARLVLEGLVRRRPELADAGLTLLTLSRPLVLMTLLAALAAVAVASLAHGITAHLPLLLAATAVAAGFGAYFLLGAVDLGLNARRLELLVKSPLALARLTLISLLGLRPKPISWARTPRG